MHHFLDHLDNYLDLLRCLLQGLLLLWHAQRKEEEGEEAATAGCPCCTTAASHGAAAASDDAAATRGRYHSSSCSTASQLSSVNEDEFKFREYYEEMTSKYKLPCVVTKKLRPIFKMITLQTI